MPVHCRSIYHLACGHARRAKSSRGFDRRSVGISDRSVVRSEIVDADGAKSSERSQTLPVGSKASFPFRSSASEVQEKRPVDARTLGPMIRVRQTPKVLRAFGRAADPTIALKWGGRTNRARNENRYAWTDEGRVRKSVLIFEEPNVLLVCRSSFGRAGDPVLALDPTFNNDVYFVFKARTSCENHGQLVHCPNRARRAKRARGFDHRSVGISDRSVVRS